MQSYRGPWLYVIWQLATEVADGSRLILDVTITGYTQTQDNTWQSSYFVQFAGHQNYSARSKNKKNKIDKIKKDGDAGN